MISSPETLAPSTGSIKVTAAITEDATVLFDEDGNLADAWELSGRAPVYVHEIVIKEDSGVVKAFSTNTPITRR